MGARVHLHPFFVGMSRHHLVLLTDAAMAAYFPAGRLIVREGEEADRFYVIESGRVQIEAQTEEEEKAVIDTLGPGELLGWSWMFPPYVWHFSARALEPTEAIYFHGNLLRQYCEKDHSLGYELFKRMSAVMASRMRKARRKMIEMHSGTAGLPGTAVLTGAGAGVPRGD